MLTEARVDADQIRDLVFGLGLNVNSPASGWPAELARSAVSLSELAGEPVDLNRLTAALIGRVLLAYERFTEGEHVDSFAELWKKYDVLRGREVTLSEAGRTRRGRALGVDDVGSLLLRDEHGHTRGYRAGEVTIDKGG
jgi:BirA family biotin operon repressor/biotin-[acetyl-CoA-carboxylase] ligase